MKWRMIALLMSFSALMGTQAFAQIRVMEDDSVPGAIVQARGELSGGYPYSAGAGILFLSDDRYSVTASLQQGTPGTALSAELAGTLGALGKDLALGGGCAIMYNWRSGGTERAVSFLSFNPTLSVSWHPDERVTLRVRDGLLVTVTFLSLTDSGDDTRYVMSLGLYLPHPDLQIPVIDYVHTPGLSATVDITPSIAVNADATFLLKGFSSYRSAWLAGCGLIARAGVSIGLGDVSL